MLKIIMAKLESPLKILSSIWFCCHLVFYSSENRRVALEKDLLKGLLDRMESNDDFNDWHVTF